MLKEATFRAWGRQDAQLDWSPGDARSSRVDVGPASLMGKAKRRWDGTRVCFAQVGHWESRLLVPRQVQHPRGLGWGCVSSGNEQLRIPAMDPLDSARM